jgi:homoserine O-acetyltransferase
VLDTDRYLVVCANVLGGCQGSTGPSSPDPSTGAPYGAAFPVVSIRDMVRAQVALADHLGVQRWQLVVGGSMGGMQVLEWAVMHPERVRAIAPLATCVAASALQIAQSAAQRAAIALDPGFHGGDYYDAAPGAGPHRGLGVARAMAQISYRSDAMFTERFGRKLLDPLDQFTLDTRFDVEGYLDYHAVKLAQRFDANSYIRLSKAMDLHDLGRSRGGVGAALERIVAPTLTMAVTSDGLYPRHQQELLRDVLRSNGVHVQHSLIDSDHGHDAFLIEHEQVADALASFLVRLEEPT